MKYRLIALGLLILLGLSTGSAEARPLRPGDINVPDGFVVDVAVDGLAAPTMVTFDDQGRMLVAESGYDGGGDAKITRIEMDGKKTRLTQPGVFGDAVPLTSVAFFNRQIYAVHAGTISMVQPDGTLKPIITDLPGRGGACRANEQIAKLISVADGWVK